MSKDMNFDDPTPKGKSARRGRRGAVKEESPFETEASIQLGNIPTATAKASGPPSARPSRRVGGWGTADEILADQMVEDSRFKTIENDSGDEEPNIPVLPDLEEPKDTAASEVTVAPNVVVNRVSTYKELDSDLLRHSHFLTIDNEVDLKLLARYLSPENEVVEEKKVWQWDRLFTEVTSEIMAEREQTQNIDTDNLLV